MRQAGTWLPSRAAAPAAAALALALALGGPAVAQSDPASKVLQQTERNAETLRDATQPPPGGVVSTPLQRAELPPPGGPLVQLRSVTFEPPSAFLSTAELDAIIAKYVGRKVDFSQISALVRDVNDLYAKKGVVTAGAILPPQNLTAGRLTVRLVEGREGAVSIVGQHVTRNDMLLKAVRLTRNGDIVDVPTASQDIARFNSTHHAQLSLLLQPGAQFGMTDITLGVREPAPNLFQLTLDNQGVASTGEIQLGAMFQKYGMLGIDDQLMVLATATRGSLAGTVNFDMPFGHVGTRISLGATASAIKVIAGPTKPLDITGRSDAVTATLTQALYTGMDLTAIALATLSSGTSQSFAAGTPIVDTNVLKASLGVAVSYSNARLSIGAQPQMIYASADDHLFATKRGIWLFAGNANGRIALSDSFSITSRAAWQYTREQLLPGSLLFQIGGYNSVRGYPSDGVGGDSGFFAQTELHWTGSGQTEGLDVYGLLDIGRVVSTFPASTNMASLGAGWTYTLPGRASLDISAAAPILPAIAGQPSLAVYAKLTGTLQ